MNRYIFPVFVTLNMDQAHDIRRQIQRENKYHAGIVEVSNHDFAYDNPVDKVTIMIMKSWAGHASYIYGIYSSVKEGNDVLESDKDVNYRGRTPHFTLKLNIKYGIPSNKSLV